MYPKQDMNFFWRMVALGIFGLLALSALLGLVIGAVLG